MSSYVDALRRRVVVFAFAAGFADMPSTFSGFGFGFGSSIGEMIFNRTSDSIGVFDARNSSSDTTAPRE
jgi:hypothetical protein